MSIDLTNFVNWFIYGFIAGYPKRIYLKLFSTADLKCKIMEEVLEKNIKEYYILEMNYDKKNRKISSTRDIT